MIIVDPDGVARVVGERDPKDRRAPSAIPHITIDQRGRAYCERCGSTFFAPVEDVIKDNLGPTRRWMGQHKDCKSLRVS